MKKEKLIKIIETIAPPHLAEDWDNSGVQLMSAGNEAKRILVCLDVCRDTVDEAIEKECDFIVSHHPMFFRGLKQIDETTAKGELVYRLIKHGISVYSAHTPFDSAQGGNNDFLAEIIGLSNVAAPEDVPIIRVGEYVSGDKVLLKDVITTVDRAVMKGSGVDYTGDLNREIRRVGICTGAGADLMDEAARLGCDLFITGDVKYHEFQAAEGLGLAMIDAGHFETEIFFCDNMGLELASRTSGDLTVIPSKAQTSSLKRYRKL